MFAELKFSFQLCIIKMKQVMRYEAIEIKMYKQQNFQGFFPGYLLPRFSDDKQRWLI
jgi:hypothetical protein